MPVPVVLIGLVVCDVRHGLRILAAIAAGGAPQD